MITSSIASCLEPCVGYSLAWLVTGVISASVFLLIVSGFAGVAVYVERKVASFIQCRLGPMEVGPGDYDALLAQLLKLGPGKVGGALIKFVIAGLKGLGFVLSLVLYPFTRRIGMPPGWYGLGTIVGDGVKLLAKEDIIPTDADPALFRLSPYIVFSATLASFAVIPFGDGLVAARLDAGVLFLLASSSVGIIGLVIGGYASNNKWSLYGSMRSVAQAVSYEVPLGLSILTVVMVVGSFDLMNVANAQAGWFWNWHIFASPFLFVSAIIFGIAALAETNRTPFDIPEAESELVSGYNTEYSGMRFALFFLAEYANILLASIVGSVFFLGGYHSGIAPLDQFVLLGPIVLLTKAALIVVFVILLRWTLPRFRVDRLMTMCWKGLLPIAVICFLGAGIMTAGLAAASSEANSVMGGLSNRQVWQGVSFLAVVGIIGLYGNEIRQGLAPMPRRGRQ